jgi:hypothetical protein
MSTHSTRLNDRKQTLTTVTGHSNGGQVTELESRVKGNGKTSVAGVGLEAEFLFTLVTSCTFTALDVAGSEWPLVEIVEIIRRGSLCISCLLAKTSCHLPDVLMSQRLVM